MKVLSRFPIKPLLWLCLALCCVACQPSSSDHRVSSPDGRIVVDLVMQGQRPRYLIRVHDTVVVDTSRLGLTLGARDLSRDLKLISTSAEETVTDAFNMPQGKRTAVTYTAHTRTFSFQHASGDRLDVIFQVSDEGVAFRYRLPDKGETIETITAEHTSFRFPRQATAFLQPMSDAKTGWSRVNPCYEEYYQKEIPVGTASPLQAGWVYPALFHTGPHWVLITEAALDRDYCATRLKAESPNGEYFIGFPEAVENFPGGGVNPQAQRPWYTPWRVLAVGSLKTIIESDLGIALAKPAVVQDTTFIRPGQSSWSWAILKDDSIVYDVQKRFVDYAADMHWEYCLVDVNWDRNIGDTRIRELAQYAAAKNVGLILWYNSSGDWNDTPYTPKSKLLTHEDRVKEFAKLQDMGIKGIKVDFFGGDGQSMIQYYLDILEDAAPYKLLVNFHGATLPRGWQRTYPHLMSAEAVKGFEYATFEQVNADEEPVHGTILPFTRNAFDPMDFTPLSLDTVPRIHRRTSSGYELALSVVFLSGIQHFVETPAGMRHAPEAVKQFLRELPAQWHDTRFISGYPGRDLVVARRHGQRWYIAGINGENKAKSLAVDLSFLQNKHGHLISDTGGPERVALGRQDITATANTTVSLGAYGGFVMVLE